MGKWRLINLREIDELDRQTMYVSIQIGINETILMLENEITRLNNVKDNTYIDLDILRNSFIEKMHREEIIKYLEQQINDCVIMQEYLKNNTKHFLTMQKELEQCGAEESNSDLLAINILYTVALEQSFNYISEAFAKYSLHKKPKRLYKDIYFIIKRITQWYMTQEKYQKKIHYNLNGKETFFILDLYRTIKEIPDKSLRRTSSLIVQIITGHRPDYSKPIRENIKHY